MNKPQRVPEPRGIVMEAEGDLGLCDLNHQQPETLSPRFHARSHFEPERRTEYLEQQYCERHERC